MEILVFYDLIKGNGSYSNSEPISGLQNLSTNKIFSIVSQKSSFDKQPDV